MRLCDVCANASMCHYLSALIAVVVGCVDVGSGSDSSASSASGNIM